MEKIIESNGKKYAYDEQTNSYNLINDNIAAPNINITNNINSNYGYNNHNSNYQTTNNNLFAGNLNFSSLFNNQSQNNSSKNYKQSVPNKASIELWTNYLRRKLTREEKYIITSVPAEIMDNIRIKKFHEKLIKIGCYIPSITENYGNCMFESLGVHGLGDNNSNIIPHKLLRFNLASILDITRDLDNFFPNLSLSSEQIFTNANEIELVLVQKHTNNQQKIEILYEYTFDLMLADLNTNHSWTRLPTELILMVVSRIYQVKILIHNNNNDYISKINVWEDIIPDDQLQTIRLGHINEEHYIPIFELAPEMINDSEYLNQISNINLQCMDSHNDYIKWQKNIINKMSYKTLNKDKKNNKHDWIDNYYNNY